jgi:cell division protein FtsB
MDQGSTGRGTRQRLTVGQAAQALGLTVDAVRSRVKRGTIEHERQGGRVYVLLSADQGRPGHDQATDQATDQGAGQAPEDRTAELIATLREQLQAERAAHSEARRLLAAALERIPSAIEAPSDSQAPPDSPPGAPRAPEDASPVTGSHEGASPMAETPAVEVGAEAAPPSTALVFAIGAGLAAGASDPPVLLPQMDNVLWLAPLLLLWVLPPIFGLWLGQNVALRMDYLYAQAHALQKQINNLRPAPENRRDEVRDLNSRMDWVSEAIYRQRGRPALYAVLVALATFCGSLGTSVVVLLPRFVIPAVLGVAIAQGIVAGMFVLFAALIGMGRARQRREAARPSAGGGVSTEASAANRQALIGLVGTIITASLALVGVLIQVFSSGGGQGGGG